MARAHIAPRLFMLLTALAGALTLAAPRVLHAQTVDEFGSPTLKGAGSTFAHPLMSAWARDYRVFRHGGVAVVAAGGGLDDEIGGAALDYEAIGSQAGIQRVKARAVDFAVSEMPLPAADLRRHGLLQVPLVAGAVAVAVNIEGQAAAELRLSPGLLVDIFLGRVKTWADPTIAQLNPGLKLPAAPIAVVHRADGSGTTYTFTAFLAQSSADWRSQVGSDLLVNWPVGEGYKGSSGVARALQRTPNAIGYLDLVQALAAKLQVASVQNASGRFVAPERGFSTGGDGRCELGPGHAVQYVAREHGRRRQLPHRGGGLRPGERRLRPTPKDGARLPRVVGHERARHSRETRLRGPAAVGGAKGTGRAALGRCASRGSSRGTLLFTWTNSR